MDGVDASARTRVERLDSLAHELLARHENLVHPKCGAPNRASRRTWLGTDLVVTVVGAHGLGRAGDPPAEAAVAGVVRAAGARTPRCLDAGYLDGDGFAVWERVQGVSLCVADLADPSTRDRYLATVRAVGAALSGSGAPAVAGDDPWSPAGVPDEAVAVLAEHVGPHVCEVVPAARELPWSLCHGDLGPSNVLFDGDALWVIDFEHTAPAPGPTSLAAELAYVASFAVRAGTALTLPGMDPSLGPRDPATLAVAAHLVARVGMHLHSGSDPGRHRRALGWLGVFLAAGS